MRLSSQEEEEEEEGGRRGGGGGLAWMLRGVCVCLVVGGGGVCIDLKLFSRVIDLC